MKIVKYGITLNRLKEEDIELVRKWRNSPQIRKFMEYREQITPEGQREWFRSVNNFNNFYFIIEYQQKKIGLINSSHVAWDTVSSEGGIFLWDEKYYETFVPVWASLCLLETTFYIFNAQLSIIKTLSDNDRAKKLNLHLGYELQPGQDEVLNQQYSLSKESFSLHAKKLIQAASLLAGHSAYSHTLSFDQEDIDSGLADFLDGKINKQRILTYSETKDGRFYSFKPIEV